MEDDKIEDTSHPFFGHSGFPFVFLPTTLTTGFTFANNQTHVSTTDNQTTTETRKKKENDDNNDDEIDEEIPETIDDDEADHNDEENDESTNEKSDLRISQPKYSQLLKELDFSHTRMVDVTNLLSNEIDQQGNYLSADENENPQKNIIDDKYQSLSSARSSDSSDEDSNHRILNKNQTKENENFLNAVNDIQNDLNNLATIIQEVTPLSPNKNGLNNLATIIQEASQFSINKNDEESNDKQKKHLFDEDDDTSKQATQNYDLNDNEQEDIIISSKHRSINQHSNDNRNEAKSFISSASSKSQNQTKKQETGNKEQQASFTWDNLVHGSDQAPQQSFTWDNLVHGSDQAPQQSFTWNNLVHGSDQAAQQSFTWNNLVHGSDSIVQPIKESHLTPKKTSEEKSKPKTSSSSKQKIHQRFQRIPSSSSSSSDTDSVVEHALHRPKQEQISSPPKQPIISSQTLRQDSQATLIDENLDELSSQLKQVLIDQERQTINTSTKEERTINGLGSMSFPLSTPDILSTDIMDNDLSNRPTDYLFRRLSNQRIDYNRYSTDIPERTSSNRTKLQQQRHSVSHHNGINLRKTDDNWLTMLEKLEREHKARLEKQQQQYRDYMTTIEEKIKRRYDDYITLNNGFQESRLDNHDYPSHIHRTHTSVPIDSNIGRYKTHTHTHQYRPLAKDLISHYYPADSTLNILTTDKPRSTVNDDILRSQSREDIVNLRTELSAKHAKQIADLKLYYEYEINELKSQLNRSRMGLTSSASTRQSMDTIERINNENIRLHDEVNDLRHSLKMTEDENILLKRQLEELREQLNTKDLDLKNYHRTISDLEHQLTEAENTKERQDEKFRHADRQVLFYQEENERIKTDLNLTRERLLRLEERYREQENENEILRRQIFMLENDTNRIKNRLTDDHKLNTTIPLNIPTSKEYGRFTLTTTTTGKTSSSPITTPRDGNLHTGRYQSPENLFHHTHSPRPMTRISDYLNEKPIYPQPYVSPTRHVYSPRKSSPNRRRIEPISTRTSNDRQTRHSDQLEQKFDQLLKKKRDLEIRLNRIPIRGLTNTDRQLSDVLQREIDRVEQQISSVKLELRKLNIFRSN